MLVPHLAEDVDPLALYGADERTAPPGRPWVLVNMIATADGATAVNGVSGSLGGPADKLVFGAVRSLPDVILVAAGTVRAERYGPPRPSDVVRATRLARGQAPSPRLAIVTRSLDLDLANAIFTGAAPGARPLIITAEAADAERRRAAAEVADVVVAGRDSVEPGAALAALRELGAQVVVCEGGPSLNGQLVAAGLVDELCLTLSPLLAAGGSARVVHGETPPAPLGLHLDRLLEEDGLVFLRYVVRR